MQNYKKANYITPLTAITSRIKNLKPPTIYQRPLYKNIDLPDKFIECSNNIYLDGTSQRDELYYTKYMLIL